MLPGGQTTQRIGVLTFPALNGQTNRSNSFTLDGVYNNGAFTSTYAIAPSIDSLEEFKVQSHSDLAEFGGVTGVHRQRRHQERNQWLSRVGFRISAQRCVRLATRLFPSPKSRGTAAEPIRRHRRRDRS